MNRMEGGGEQGVERINVAAGNSPTGTAMHANAQQAAVGTGTATAQAVPSLVGQAGSLVGTGHMLPPAQNAFGSYGPMRGGLMDPRNYSQNQGFLGCQGHGCSGCSACQGYPGHGVHGQGLHGQGQFGQGQGGQGLTGQGLGGQGLMGQGLHGQGLHGQGMPGQGCTGTACQNAQASTGRSQEPNLGGAC